MQMSSVNSLVEVGIGVNLAFGAFKSMRDGLYDVFNKSVESKTIVMYAQLNEDGISTAIRSKIAVKSDDIRKNYSDKGSSITRIMVVVALVSALILTSFLIMSAILPNEDIPVGSVYPVVSFVLGPLCISAFAQFALFANATLRLSKTIKAYSDLLCLSNELDIKLPTS